MIVKPLTAESNLTSASAVGNASCVRLYNSDSAASVITNDTTSASFTMPGGSVAFMVKSPADTISASGNGANVLVTSVAFTVS